LVFITQEEGINMMRGNWVLGIAAVVGLCIAAANGRADDAIKLNLKSKDAVKTTNLLGDGGADTLDVHRWGWGRPYYRGYYGYRYYYPRVWAYSYYYPRVYINRPYYYGYVAPAPVYYSEPYYVEPIGLSVRAPFVSLNITRAQRAAVPAEESIPAPRPAMPKPNPGTFQYDGGPANPVPMPQAEPAPTRTAPVIPEGRVVSITTSKTPKYSYSAYGETAASKTVVEKQQLAAKPK
jgi:hypothetical protein